MKVQEMKRARYLATFGEDTTPIHVFFQDIEHPQGSHYFGLYQKITPTDLEGGFDSRWMIIDGQKFIKPITGIICADGTTVIYSCHRHDYTISPIEGDTTMIDGGFEYQRYSGNSDKIVKIGVVGEKFVLLPYDTEQVRTDPDRSALGIQSTQ